MMVVITHPVIVLVPVASSDGSFKSMMPSFRSTAERFLDILRVHLAYAAYPSPVDMA